MLYTPVYTTFNEMDRHRMSSIGWMAFLAILCADLFPSAIWISIGGTEANPIGFPAVAIGKAIMIPLSMFLFERLYWGPKIGWRLVWAVTFMANAIAPILNLLTVMSIGA